MMTRVLLKFDENPVLMILLYTAKFPSHPVHVVWSEGALAIIQNCVLIQSAEIRI